jgi:hypothetical protein
MLPLASVAQLPVSVPDDQLSVTVELGCQFPPDTPMKLESVALVNAYEFGETPMNGVGVIVVLSIVSAPPWHVSGTTVVPFTGSLIVRERLSGLPDVKAGVPTVKVPLAPAVMEPLNVPGTETVAAPVGKALGTVSPPLTVRLGLPVPPVTLNGTLPAKVTVSPAVVSA